MCCPNPNTPFKQLPLEIDRETVSLLWNRTGRVEASNTTPANVGDEFDDVYLNSTLGKVVEDVFIRSLRLHTTDDDGDDDGYNGGGGGPGLDGACLGNPILRTSCIFAPPPHTQKGCPHIMVGIGADVNVTLPDVGTLLLLPLNVNASVNIRIRMPPFVLDIVSGKNDANNMGRSVEDVLRLEVDRETTLVTAQSTLVRPSVTMPNAQSSWALLQAFDYDVTTISASRPLLDRSYLQNFLPRVKLVLRENEHEEYLDEGGEGVKAADSWTPGFTVGLKRTRGTNPHLQLTMKVLDDVTHPIQKQLPFRKVTSEALHLETLWVQQFDGDELEIRSLGSMGVAPLYLSPETAGRGELLLMELVFDVSSDQAKAISAAAEEMFESLKQKKETPTTTPFVDLRVVSTAPGSFFEHFGAWVGFATDPDPGDHLVCIDVKADTGPKAFGFGGQARSEGLGLKLVAAEFLSLVDNTWAFQFHSNVSLPADVALDLPKFSFDVLDDEIILLTLFTNDTIPIADGLLSGDLFFRFPNVSALVNRDADGTLTIQATPDYSIISDFLSEVKLEIGILEDITGVRGGETGGASAPEDGDATDDEEDSFLGKTSIAIDVDIETGMNFVTISIPIQIVTPEVEGLETIAIKAGRMDLQLLQHSPQGSKCRSMELTGIGNTATATWSNVMAGPSEDCDAPLLDLVVSPLAFLIGGIGTNENTISMVFQLSQPMSQQVSPSHFISSHHLIG
jgi:hypothetical protein